MATAAALPREVVLRSRYNDRYLEYVEDEGSVKGFLQFGREDFTSPLSKFLVEPARGDSQLVHLKSNYNNKYLRADTETTRWIIPGADGPEEDQSKWSCTLFRPVPSPGDGDDFRFMHVRTGNFIALMKMGAGNAFDNCLFAGLQLPLQDLSDVVTVIAWSPSMVLPREVALRSRYNDKYLEYVTEEGKAKGFLRFGGEDLASPLSKFEVEPSRSDSQMVHLRSRYNNKYLTTVNETTRWIVPEANGPEEDISKWSCTLFRPALVGRDGYRFMHVRTGNYVALMKMGADSAFDNCLYAGLPYPLQDTSDVVTAIESTSSVVFPRYVAFKGDNGNYLSARHVFGGDFLLFESTNSGDRTVAHEVFPNPDGTIRLKSTHFDRFWRLDDSIPQFPYVYPNSDGTDINDKNTLFLPIKIDDNTIALRSLANDHFCKRVNALRLSNILSAGDPTISSFSRLHVTDLTRSREINTIEFDLMRASKYDEQVVVMGTGEGSNTTNEALPLDIKVKYGKPTSMRWDINHSLSSGVKVKLVTKVPLIVDGKIQLSPETTMLCEMGVVETTTDIVETVYNALVPPMTRATVYAKGSSTMCDVPFSYNQTDTYIDEIRHTRTLDDGTYTGMNCFNLFYEVKFENINPKI